jgi:hypothetical protein
LYSGLCAVAAKDREVVVFPHFGCPVNTTKLPSGIPPFKTMSKDGLTGMIIDFLSTIALPDKIISFPKFLATSSLRLII